MGTLTGLDWAGVAVLIPDDLTPTEKAQLKTALGWIEAGAMKGDAERIKVDLEARKSSGG
jgi:hypothetical protein